MPLEVGTSVLLVVTSEWSEDPCVRLLLGPTKHGRPGEIKSHNITAKIIDPEDSLGLWIELYTARPSLSPIGKPFEFLVPWRVILTIAIAPPSDPGSDADIDELEKLFQNSPDE
ncbi:MAG: hypothetical protein ABSH47_01620 [Bryobacteraceae bacterium]